MTARRQKGSQTDVVKAFHALSDETRLQIIHLLRNGEKCVCDLTEALDAAQSRLSFHLKTLKDAGLVHDRREGRWVYYTLNAETFARLEKALAALKPGLRIVTGSAGRC